MEMVTEIQTFNRDGVAYGVGECKVYWLSWGCWMVYNGECDGVCGRVCDGVCGGVCDGVCDGWRLSWRLSQAEGVTEMWLFGKDSFKECPLTLFLCFIPSPPCLYSLSTIPQATSTPEYLTDVHPPITVGPHHATVDIQRNPLLFWMIEIRDFRCREGAMLWFHFFMCWTHLFHFQHITYLLFTLIISGTCSYPFLFISDQTCVYLWLFITCLHLIWMPGLLLVFYMRTLVYKQV